MDRSSNEVLIVGFYAGLAMIAVMIIAFLYNAIKSAIDGVMTEMMNGFNEIHITLKEVDKKVDVITKDVARVKLQLNDYITVDKYYNSIKVVNQDVNEIREKVERIEKRKN